MKNNRKNISIILIFSILGILIGSIAWEILERIVILITGNSSFSLTIKNPIQLFDFYVLSISFRANPGTILGFLGGIILSGKF